MQKNVLIPLALVGVVVALVAVNLAIRGNPEPEPRQPLPVPAAAAGDDELEEGAPGEGSHEEGERETLEPDGASAEEETGEERVVGCDHPFIAAELGQWRRYRWQESREDRAAELRLRPRGTRQLPSGERVVTWAARVHAADDDSELAEATLTTRCVPGQDSEEPWFGILERSLGLRLTDEPGRWRWPAELSEGQRFEGTAHFDPRGAEMRVPEGASGPQTLRVTRRHVVEGRESVEVPAGRFHAWKVLYQERHAYGERGEEGTGTLWVAPGIGLVKSRAENSRGVVQTLELTSMGGG